jgi:hypothetical protein
MPCLFSIPWGYKLGNEWVFRARNLLYKTSKMRVRISKLLVENSATSKNLRVDILIYRIFLQKVNINRGCLLLLRTWSHPRYFWGSVFPTCNSYLYFETDYSLVSWPFYILEMQQYTASRYDLYYDISFTIWYVSLYTVLINWINKTINMINWSNNPSEHYTTVTVVS